MKITYVGCFADGVELEVEGEAVVAKPGDPIDVPSELGESLLEQSSWARPNEAAKQANRKNPQGDD